LATALARKPGITQTDCQKLLHALSGTPALEGDSSPQGIGHALPAEDAPETSDEMRYSRHSQSWDALDTVADQLARVVRARWKREEEHRGVHDPIALPLRWQPASATLTDSWENIQRVPPGATADPVDLTGALDDIAVVFRRIRSGRLVVLGRAGSGKTILTLRFVLDYLSTRSTSADPVPVIFSLGSWDPTTVGLRDWLIDRLVRDHPDLDTGAPGRSTLAAALVDDDRILPVLDGFDEIATGLREAELAELNTTTLPLLLTSRTDEYEEAVTGSKALTAAAGIEKRERLKVNGGRYI